MELRFSDKEAMMTVFDDSGDEDYADYRTEDYEESLPTALTRRRILK